MQQHTDFEMTRKIRRSPSRSLPCPSSSSSLPFSTFHEIERSQLHTHARNSQTREGKKRKGNDNSRDNSSFKKIEKGERERERDPVTAAGAFTLLKITGADTSGKIKKGREEEGGGGGEACLISRSIKTALRRAARKEKDRKDGFLAIRQHPLRASKASAERKSAYRAKIY